MMEEIIAELQKVNEPVPVPLELPTMDDIIDVEEQLFLSVGNDFREFLLKVSNVIYGTLEPVTVADPHSHTYLPEIASIAWSLGVPRDLVPLCESRGSYYCVNEMGEVVHWENSEIREQTWPSIWHWAEDVWLNC